MPIGEEYARRLEIRGKLHTVTLNMSLEMLAMLDSLIGFFGNNRGEVLRNGVIQLALSAKDVLRRIPKELLELDLEAIE